MNLRVIILPKKILADGTHKVRIAISHNGTTRYIPTRFIVPSESNLVNGQIVGVPNVKYVNQKIREQLNSIYEAYDKIEYAQYLTCAQLLKEIDYSKEILRPKTLCEVADECINIKRLSSSDGSICSYTKSAKKLREFFGDSLLIKDLSSKNVSEYQLWLASKYSKTTVSIKMTFLTIVINYAIKHKFVDFQISPLEDIKIPKANVRNCNITIEQLRRIRDLDFASYNKKVQKGLEICRSWFLLSFFLCGMNVVDLLKMDFSNETITFSRQKNKATRRGDSTTTFKIQPEARIYIERLESMNFLKPAYNTLQMKFHRYMPKLADVSGIKSQFIFYSARKTFAQLANELMIKDSIIEYCIGDSVHGNKVIGFYVSINQRMADKAIRKVFDAVASDKSIEELIEECL